jgi:hypothetical protein
LARCWVAGLGEHVGIPTTLVVGMSGGMVSSVWLLQPHIRLLQQLPEPTEQ